MNAQTEWIGEASAKLDKIMELTTIIPHLETALGALESSGPSPSRQQAIECVKAAIYFVQRDKHDILK